MMFEENKESPPPKAHFTILIAWILSAIFILLIGASLTIAFLTFLYGISVASLTSEHWALIATLCLIALYLTNIYRVKVERKKKLLQRGLDNSEIAHVQADSSLLRDDLERFKRDFMSAFKAHLKVSILFWIHYYKKEKVKSWEETRKEIFKDLRKEFNNIIWMDELLDELSLEISKYKDPNAPKPKKGKPEPEAEM